ncbi:MAG: ROK family protein [Tissierellia bacterium]|nr:ROK family protein [Tissierellia bacterium]
MRKVIGIDLGGTGIFGAVMNENGEILKKAEKQTPSNKGRKAVLEAIIEIIERLWSPDILGIGIGSPGCIDSENGRALEIGGNISGWANTDIRGEIKKAYPNTPIYVENDANVAGLCEAWMGAGKNLNSFVMLTLGTGVGGAIYLEDGRLIKGYNFQGAELGHAILYPKGKICNCGQRGCVDKYLSGHSIEEKYFELTKEKKSGKDIFKDSEKDPIAAKIIEEYAEDLAIYLVSLKNIFDPQGIIIGGGVINSKAFWWDKMLKYYKIHSNSIKSMQIVPARYLNDAGMIGAGRIVFINEADKK